MDQHVAPLGQHYPDSEPTSLCSYCVFSREAVNINFIVFGLTQQGFKTTIYHTPGYHANHYNTDMVGLFGV
jgi:hypothetical protein